MTDTAPRRRALLVAPYFVPRRRVGVNRPLRFATHLPAHGWEPTVVRLRASGAPAPREAARIAGLDVRDLAAPFDRTAGAEHARAPRERPAPPDARGPAPSTGRSPSTPGCRCSGHRRAGWRASSGRSTRA